MIVRAAAVVTTAVLAATAAGELYTIAMCYPLVAIIMCYHLVANIRL